MVKRFSRHGAVIRSRLSAYEVSLLSSLCHQLTEILHAAIPDAAAPLSTDDPLTRLDQELAADEEVDLTSDPAIRRLFPNPYPHDAEAATDFRRFAVRDQRDRKLADVETVLADLEATQRGVYPVRIEIGHADAWLKTLTSVRLAVASRLGITDADAADELAEIAEEDPRSFLASVYDWLGFAQETLVLALDR